MKSGSKSWVRVKLQSPHFFRSLPTGFPRFLCISKWICSTNVLNIGFRIKLLSSCHYQQVSGTHFHHYRPAQEKYVLCCQYVVAQFNFSSQNLRIECNHTYFFIEFGRLPCYYVEIHEHVENTLYTILRVQSFTPLMADLRKDKDIKYILALTEHFLKGNKNVPLRHQQDFMS